MIKSLSAASIRRSFWLLTLVLASLGLLFVFEASVAEAFAMVQDPYYFVKQQAIRLVIGLVLMVVASRVPLSWWQRTSWLWYGAGVVLLVLVFIPGLGLELNGARRWLAIGGIVIQPVEIMKLGICVFFADWLHRHQKLAPWLFLTGLPAALIIKQPDLGSLLIVASIAYGLLWLAGTPFKTWLGLGGLGVTLVALAIATSTYRQQRVQTFLNPESDPLGASFHIRQITLALGNGRWFGQGLGNSKQKYSYIPEASTDSIFAIVGEELGFVGALVIIGLWTAYLTTAYHLCQLAADPYARLLGGGILVWLAMQVILNLAAVVALVPLTGVPLPLFSYGGSSLLMILLASGILLQVSQSTSPPSKHR
jgi:cell division protein FtsW